MTTYTYSQLEGLWIQNGGSVSLAPVMAAIALAESRGVNTARNDKDNGGTQSSFGLWQISTGTHTPPAANWSDPNVNASLAVSKYKSQGLKAWGTYTSGAYQAFLSNGVPPTSVQGSTISTGGGTTATAVSDTSTAATCAWNLTIPVQGDICVATKTQLRVVIAVTLMGTGLALGVVGLILLTKFATGSAAGNAITTAAKVIL